MRRRGALLIGFAALIVFLLVSTAAANWTHKGKGELKENASVTLSGELTLSTSAGNITCSTAMGGILTASGSAGDVNSFTVTNPSECDLTGSLGAICGTHGLTKVEKTGTWSLVADENDITLSSIDVHYVMAGCLIPSFRLKGSATMSLDKATAIGNATLSGTQTLYNSAGEEAGTGELKGTLSASPAGTYGVKTGATVETIWTDGNSHLGTDGKLTLAGTFSFSGSGGSISCEATVKLLLESSTVEEEEAEGEIESFAVANPSACDLGGGYKTTCGTNSVSKVEQTGTATLTATEEDITVSGLVLDYEIEKCAIPSLRVEGSPTISVSNPESIASASFSAGALEVFNSKGETIGTASAGGSASASPSGTFQLKEKPVTEDPVSLSETSGPLGVGSEVTATSTNLKVVQVEGATLTCQKVTLHFEVLVNGPSHVELEQTQTAGFVGCKANGVLPVTFENAGATSNLTFDGWGTANLGSTFISKAFLDAGHTMPASVPCDYAGTLHLVPFGESGTDQVEVTKSTLTAAGCKNEIMEGMFTLETTNGTRVDLNYTETP